MQGHDKIKGTITELFALSKGIKFGTKQIESLLLLYKTVCCGDSFITVRLGQG